MKFQERNSNGAKLDFLKLTSGQSAKGVFRGDIYEFKRHWVNQRSVTCPGSGCEHCTAGDKPSFRFRLNFVINENGALTAKVFEQGWTVYDTLRALHADYNLETYQMKVTRSGEGTNTSYQITPVPKGEVTKDMEAKIKTIKLHELSPEQEKDAPAAEEEEDGDVPF